ncbi:MAG: hypothetical protein IGS48_21590 [Oscillatoriales cyanobacterium C42_A2020_001]|nr:hypothetical protein [Leptolyngbyaceae cyanobacterium C42_A2020_001]
MSDLSMSEQKIQSCSVCGVKIIPMVGGDRVLFSVGPPGTRDTLWQKVCRHTQNLACINRREGK